MKKCGFCRQITHNLTESYRCKQTITIPGVNSKVEMCARVVGTQRNEYFIPLEVRKVF